MQAALGRGDVQRPCELPLRRFHQDRLSLGVQHAHASKVAFELTVPDEVGQHSLFQHVGVHVGGQMGGYERVHQLRWCHEVPESKPRKEHLAEGAHVDDTAPFVDPLERGEGLAHIPELGVVVVFHHP